MVMLKIFGSIFSVATYLSLLVSLFVFFAGEGNVLVASVLTVWSGVLLWWTKMVFVAIETRIIRIESFLKNNNNISKVD